MGMPDDAAPAETAEPPSTSASTLIVPARFCGPTGSANGGFVASRVASYVGVTSAADTAPHGVEPRAVATALRTPVPLDTPLSVNVVSDVVTLRLDGAIVAEAWPAELDTDPLEPVTYEEALAAGEHFPGYTRHPMPNCFGCGVDRAPADGLRLAVGPVGDGRVAAAWEPGASLLPAGVDTDEIAPEFAWTVLDCTAGWSWDIAGEPALLGTMTAIVDEAPYVGDRCVAVGGLLRREGRKLYTASSLYDADGRVLGRAQSVWITVEPGRFDG